MCIPNPNPPFQFSSKRFFKRSSSQLQETVRATTAWTSDAYSAVPTNTDLTAIAEKTTSADQASKDGPAATANKATTDGPAATAGHAPLGAEEKVP